MKNVNPACPENRTDCFASWGNKCRILTDTDFRDGKPCPFYKNKNETDQKITPKRIRKKKN